MASAVLQSMLTSFTGDIPKFEKLDDRYKCEICKNVLQIPMVSLCGHRMCKECATNYIASKGGTSATCPVDDDCEELSMDTLMPDLGVFRDLKKLKVYCTNTEYGCEEILPWGNLKSHLESCEYALEDCVNKGFGCKARVGRVKMQDHVQNDCQFRTKKCEHCDTRVPERLMEEHLQNSCTAVSVTCSSCGEQSVLRGEKVKPSVDPAELDGIKMSCGILEKKQERQEDSLKKVQKMLAGISDSLGTVSGMQREVATLKDTIRVLETTMQTSKPADDQKQQFSQMDQKLSLVNMRLQEMDLRLQCVETASYDGTLIWKIRDFKRRKSEAENGRTMSLYSQPFYTSRYGYKACARIYLNGDGMGKGTHLSLFFVILRGDFDALLPWPFRQKVTMTLIDQEGGKKNIVDSFRADPTSNSFKRPTSDMNIASGCPLFAAQSQVQAPPYLKDDCIYLKMQVDTKDLKDASYDLKSGSYDSSK